MTKFHAQKALSKNGKIIANNIMIGVLPCIDKVNLLFKIVSSLKKYILNLNRK